MTTLQLKLAVAIKELGSISNAAKELAISQPNASKYIRALEKEIGLEIFERAKGGIVTTEKGSLFLERAKRILVEHNEILDIKNHLHIYRLRIGAVNYLSAADPFLTLCEQHRDEEEAELRFSNVSIDEGIDELDNFNLDLVFAPALKTQVAGIESACEKKNLKMISIGMVPAVISVRKDHPALLDGRCENIKQGSDAMKEFPYAAYSNLGSDSDDTGYGDSEFIKSKYIIYVDEVTVRLRLVASTNAFMFGITPSKGVNERYGLVSLPVPGISLEAYCLMRKSDCDRKEVEEYISLLKKELDLK